MSEAKKRQIPAPDYKAKIGIEAIRGIKTMHQIAMEYGVHPVQVGQYKKQILSQASQLFEAKRGPKPRNAHSESEQPYAEVMAAQQNGR